MSCHWGRLAGWGCSLPWLAHWADKGHSCTHWSLLCSYHRAVETAAFPSECTLSLHHQDGMHVAPSGRNLSSAHEGKLFREAHQKLKKKKILIFKPQNSRKTCPTISCLCFFCPKTVGGKAAFIWGLLSAILRYGFDGWAGTSLVILSCT